MARREPELLFKSKRFDVVSIDTQDAKGFSHTRQYIHHPGAVVILPLLDPETILFIKNKRYVIDQTLLELPAGTLEKNEEPHHCAARELIEETGYRAGTLIPLFSFYTTPGFCNEILHAFLATDLTHVGQDLDVGEEISVEPLSFRDALKKVAEGTLVDAKTLATLFHYLTKNMA